ncbi:MAG: hypothetical protein ACK56I_28315, partial [bacterium]
MASSLPADGVGSIGGYRDCADRSRCVRRAKLGFGRIVRDVVHRSCVSTAMAADRGLLCLLCCAACRAVERFLRTSAAPAYVGSGSFYVRCGGGQPDAGSCLFKASEP